MYQGKGVLALIALWCAATPVALAAALGDPAAGQKKSIECQGCHGTKGVSVDPTIPKLAGQFREYLAKQISEFQVQNRNDERMSPVAAKMTKTKDLLDIAAYFSAQPIMTGKPSKSPALGLGRTIYENGLPKRGLEACIHCHGETGRGNAARNPTFPMIGGQHKEYLLKQLTAFRHNKRNTDPTEIMSNVGRILSAQELDAVAEYVASL
jgi:cytochrome c553